MNQSSKKSFIVDREYPGKEAVVTKLVLEMSSNRKIIPHIHFRNIGKTANAHDYAYKVAAKRLKVQKVITFQEIIKKIKKTEAGNRLKNV
jgi:hypothetical protein